MPLGLFFKIFSKLLVAANPPFSFLSDFAQANECDLLNPEKLKGVSLKGFLSKANPERPILVNFWFFGALLEP